MKSITKEEIISELNRVFKETEVSVQSFDNNTFEISNDGKWSAAENFQHLILSGKPVANGLKTPKLVLVAFGRSKNGSRSYDELVAAYKQKLAEGGKATPKFVPKEEQTLDKKEMLLTWQKTNHFFGKNLEAWSEKELDRYRMPHPLLGKLTVREMLMFTIYHTHYHLDVMKKIQSRG